jgi:hypothetical protein
MTLLQLVIVGRQFQLVLIAQVIICVLIITALLRMKNNTILDDAKSLVGKFIILIMETM